jgi:hypothetical protein
MEIHSHSGIFSIANARIADLHLNISDGVVTLDKSYFGRLRLETVYGKVSVSAVDFQESILYNNSGQWVWESCKGASWRVENEHGQITLTRCGGVFHIADVAGMVSLHSIDFQNHSFIKTQRGRLSVFLGQSLYPRLVITANRYGQVHNYLPVSVPQSIFSLSLSVGDGVLALYPE